ncbi:MAG: hypothetical protein JWO91_3369 [Acidobacteriaceae bacterium]|nr:hypothetical protein [Acidobacteriaceae bacterium]
MRVAADSHSEIMGSLINSERNFPIALVHFCELQAVSLTPIATDPQRSPSNDYKTRALAEIALEWHKLLRL